MIKAVFFDLDGTLLPMNQDEFTKLYFGSLAKKVAPLGYETEKFIASIWSGVKAMVKNDGNLTNEQVFWNKFAEIYGEQSREHIPYFEEYYKNDFVIAKNACKANPKAVDAVKSIKSAGKRLILATNPIFPELATMQRIDWAGLDAGDFEIITTYENSSSCKPNLDYYRSIIKQTNLSPEDCLMVGNDVSEDMVAEKLGMQVFLLTDCIINKNNEDISKYPHGDFNVLLDFLANK